MLARGVGLAPLSHVYPKGPTFGGSKDKVSLRSPTDKVSLRSPKKNATGPEMALDGTYEAGSFIASQEAMASSLSLLG